MNVGFKALIGLSTARAKAGLQAVFVLHFIMLFGTIAQGAGPVAAPDQQRQEEMLLAAARKYFPSDDSGVASKRIFRLTRQQLDASVAALLPGYKLPSIKETMSRDPLQTNYEYAELLSFSAANVSGLTGWIKRIAETVAKEPQVLLSCTKGAADVPCLEAFARGFATKAFRGDGGDDKADLVAKFFVGGVKAVGVNQALAELIEIVLSSPDFLFRKELSTDRGRRLSPSQLLQALSYTIADVPPEGVGLDSRDSAKYFSRQADAGATLDAIVNSSQAREKLVRFFKAWLEVKERGDFTISAAVFPEFDAKLEEAMLRDTEQFLRQWLSRDVPTLQSLTQSEPLPVGEVSTSLGGGQGRAVRNQVLLKNDPAQRLGLFSLPAVLASHSGPTNTRLIKRGVFWVRKVMCMEMEPPPPGVDTTLYEAAHTTERQRIEDLTAKKACIGCHKFIDPFGFALESYDALGRWRTTDNGHPIDTNIEVDFLDEGPLTATGPVEALKAFTNSLMFKQCFVRQLFRHYMGRNEDGTDDSLLRRMFIQLVREDNLLELLRMLASSDRIGRRQ